MTVAGQRHGMGLRFDPYDPRDLLFVAPPRILPLVVDHRDEATAVRDQGSEGSCTGHALVGAAELLYWRRQGSPPDLSERWAYEKAREHDEWPGTAYEGSSIRGAVKGWLKTGLCEESQWPYVPGERGAPTAEAAANARSWGIGQYERCQGMENLKHALHHRGVVVAGATVHQGWLEAEGAEIIPFAPDKPAIGGHAFLLLGYDDHRQVFWVKNSWGTGWGIDGFAGLTYQDALLGIRDAWTFTIPEGD